MPHLWESDIMPLKRLESYLADRINKLNCYWFFKNLFIFNWRIIALQKFVVFYQTSTWIIHRYTYIICLLNLPKHRKRLYTWISPDGQKPKSDWLYPFQTKMETLYTLSKNKTGSRLWLRSWPPYCQNQT